MAAAHGSTNSAPQPGSRWPVFRSLAGYRPSDLPRDLVAGLTLAAIAIPEQMATARLGGFSPEIGFFAFIAGSLGFALFGASRSLSCGADSTIAPIFAGGVALLAAAGSPHYGALAAALALMVGLALVAGWLFRLGWIADLLSIPVTTGFLAGISIHILVSQLPSVLGIADEAGSLLQRGAYLAAHLHEANRFTLAIGLGVFAIVVLSELVSARIPGALIGLVLATVALAAFGLEGKGVAVIGTVPAGWPSVKAPTASIAELAQLLPLSLLIALVVMVQTAATTRAFPSNLDAAPDVDRDFLGVGVGGVMAAIVGAFPVDASPPRTAIVSETGGRSQLAGLAACAILLAVAVFGAQLLTRIPAAALAGVLLFVALRIIRVEQMGTIFRQSFGEFLLVVATFAAIVAMPIEQGVAIGVALSLLHGVWSVTRAHVISFERVPGTTVWWPSVPDHHGETLPEVRVLAFQAPLSFLTASRFRADVLAALRAAPQPTRLAILEASAIVEIDFTAAQTLRSLIRQCKEEQIIFAIARLESVRAQNALKRFGIDKALGPHRLFRSVEDAVRALRPQPPAGRASQ
ncbi:SulP family inorganic anion transporter [Methylocapsa acidiphila]|uniref:SulP family inorganic anion transporter n=1 Tax=Methylocapsa acidiphila TaxID=133552 RepID=UPI0003FF2358|nr:SulP family inorganic anion transporter [Methylocapsa acidiphila]